MDRRVLFFLNGDCGPLRPVCIPSPQEVSPQYFFFLPPFSTPFPPSTYSTPDFQVRTNIYLREGDVAFFLYCAPTATVSLTFTSKFQPPLKKCEALFRAAGRNPLSFMSLPPLVSLLCLSSLLLLDSSDANQIVGHRGSTVFF